MGDTKDGDVSPINHLSEDSKPSSSRKKLEPTSETKPNFSRVTPAQLAYISFPSDGRYQPVRTVTSSKQGRAFASKALGVGSEKYAGSGGILILSDLRPDEEAEFIELEAPVLAPPPPEVTPAAATAAAAAAPQPTGRHIALDESSPDAPPPEPFEVSCPFPPALGYRAHVILFSILSTMTHKLSNNHPLYFFTVRFIPLISLSIVFHSEDPNFMNISEELCSSGLDLVRTRQRL